MKKLVVFLSLSIVTMLLTATVVTLFNTPVQATASVLGVAQLSFYALTYFNIVPLPAGILGAYVGAPGTGDSGIQVINSERKRGAYMSYKTDSQYAGKSITPSFLRLEALIDNTTNVLKFKTYVGDGLTQNPSERRLDRNDKFGAIAWGFFIVKQADGKSNGRLHSYPNLTDFVAAAPDLESLYNGIIEVTINSKKEIVAFDTQNFLTVPETQQSGATNRDQRDFQKYLLPLTPHLNLDGSATNDISLSYPSHAGWVGGTAAGGFKHIGVLYLQGFLITGGSANI